MSFNTTYRVCTFPYEPLVFCLDQNLQKHTDIYGFHVDLFSTIAKKIGMTFTLKCIGYTAFVHDMRASFDKTIGDPMSSCDIYIGAQEVTSWLYDRYYVSPPLLWSGLNILTLQINKYKFRFLGFLEGFSWDLHISILSFAVFAAVATVIISYYTNLSNDYIGICKLQKTIPLKVKYFINCCLYNIAMLVNGNVQLDENHYQSNIIPKLHAIGYGFISTIVIAYYTAITTAAIAIPTQQTKIKNLQTVRASGFKIGIPLRYVSLARGQLNLQNIEPYNWETSGDTSTMLEDLQNDKIQGILIDSLVARYHQTKNCQLRALSQDVFLMYQPVYFKKSTDKSLLDTFFKSVIVELTTETYTMYSDKYVALGEISCNLSDTPTVIHTRDIYGLFMTGLIICILSIILTILRFYVTKYMIKPEQIKTLTDDIEAKTDISDIQRPSLERTFSIYRERPSIESFHN